jgi:hypothetical protein
VSAPSPTTTSSSTTTASSSTSSSSTQSSTKESSSSGGGNVGLALSIIGKNSERDAAGSAVAQSAMAQAQQAATQSQQEAASVASNAVSNSMTANAVTVGSQQFGNSGVKTNNATNNSQSSSSSMSSMISPVNAMTGSVGPVAVISSQQSFDPIVVGSIVQTTYSSIISNTVTSNSIQTSESYSLLTPNMLTDKTNPLTDIVEGKQSVPQNNTTTISGPVVNKNSQDNDIAVGVNINKMALAPTGYNDYLNFTLRDAAFYAPKVVYPNQRTVDNARALRQLASDAKHRELVESQYSK